MGKLSEHTLRVFATLARFASFARLGSRTTALVARRLIEAQKLNAADALLEAARVSGENNHAIATAYALSAQSRGLYREAIERWNHARRLGAKEPFASSRLAACLRLLGEHSAAQILLDDALVRYSADARILSEAARLAQDRDCPHAAVDLWRRAIISAKPHADWLLGFGESLLLTGDLERSSRVIASARRQYPNDLGLITVEGKLALAREDWTRAIALWTEHRRRSPDDETSWESLGLAVHGAQLSEATQEQALPPDQVDDPMLEEDSVLDDDAMRRLLLGFESIGDNCELGLVQRRFGAEPLGLLRWNDVQLDNLIAALGHAFEGMGEPGNTAIAPAANGELFVTDRRWHLAMHTFLHVDRADPDDVFRKMCRRIVYLRDKLIEDLESARKVFVYRSSDIDIDGLRRLHRALRAYGPVTLLGVQPVLTTETAFPGRPVGEVERLEEGLHVGFLSRPFYLDAQDTWDIDFDTWTAIFSKFMKAREPDRPHAAGVDESHAMARNDATPGQGSGRHTRRVLGMPLGDFRSCRR